MSTVGMTTAPDRARRHGGGRGRRSWCLGDLVGSEPVTPGLVGGSPTRPAHRRKPRRLGARARPGHRPRRDVFRLARRAMASRHGIDCWHGSPRHPRVLTEASAAGSCPTAPWASLGLVGHTLKPASLAYDGATARATPRPRRVLRLARDRCLHRQPGAVCGNPRRCELVAHHRRH
jgi:hypothetical protein